MLIVLSLIIILLFIIILLLLRQFRKEARKEKKLSALMFFCENGHMVTATDQPEELEEITQIPPCFCGSQHLRALANWPTENTEIVPNKVIRYEQAGLERDIEVFDVSKLFSKDYSSPWDINWDEIPADLKGLF